MSDNCRNDIGTAFELFFDLVFVFGFTEVTTLLREDPSWHGLGRGLLALTVLWWAGAAYAWRTNELDPNRGPVLAAMLVSTGAMFLAALAVPGAFGDDRFLFAVSFVVVLGMWVVLYALAARGTPDLLGAILRTAPGRCGRNPGARRAFLGASSALAVAAAVVAGFLGPLLTPSTAGVPSGALAERHGLIIIIAVGESPVAIGLSARNTGLGAASFAVLLGLAIAASMWLALRLRRRLAAAATRQAAGRERVRLARDAYSYLHLPMIVGIVVPPSRCACGRASTRPAAHRPRGRLASARPSISSVHRPATARRPPGHPRPTRCGACVRGHAPGGPRRPRAGGACALHGRVVRAPRLGAHRVA
jgi:low temperature requirement protein LtrA